MFSVIIPTYNRAHVIVDTLNSVKEQTYRPIEIIVVDDGSTDDTEVVVKRWQEVNRESRAEDRESNAESGKALVPRPSSLFHQPLSLLYIKQANAGAAAARNRGLKECSGDYIQFLDSDDRLHSERFAVLARAFEEKEADFIQTSIEWFDPNTGEVVNTLWARPQADQVDLVIKGDFWACTLRGALRKELAVRIDPWDESYKSFEDRPYMENAVMQAKKPIALQPVLGYLARGPGEHVSSSHRTREGRRWRIDSERKLVEQVLKRTDVSDKQRSILASRIYRIGCRSAARGWYDYAKECADIGDRLKAQLPPFAHFKRLFCKMGPSGGKLYHLVCRIKGLPDSY